MGEQSEKPEKKKVYCHNCARLIRGMFMFECDVLKDTFFQPSQPSDPAAKNCMNDCPDHVERPTLVPQKPGAMDN